MDHELMEKVDLILFRLQTGKDKPDQDGPSILASDFVAIMAAVEARNEIFELLAVGVSKEKQT